VESELVLEDAEHELVTARHQLAAAIGEDEVVSARRLASC
jgi:hypothetical protein